MLAQFRDLVEKQTWQVVDLYRCFAGEGFDVCYERFDALTSAWALVAFFIIYSFVFSIVGNNCSKVDQLWSITPVLYVWHFFWYDKRVHPELGRHDKLLALCVLVTLWGTRLTYNFWRKGGYGNLITHEEDYRWPILRRQMHPIVFLLFNLTFIATYQNVLLFLIAAPAYEILKSEQRALQTTDIIVIIAFLLLLLMESVADEQHFQFQTLKHSLTPAARAQHAQLDVRRGFFTQGLFRFCRHPNYFAEQSMWVAVYVLSTTSNVVQWNWTLCGCLQLILLFQGSMSFGESITLQKYPLYAAYQRSTSRCIPWLPGAVDGDSKWK